MKMLAYHPMDAFSCIDCHVPVASLERPSTPDTCPVKQGHFLNRNYAQASCGNCHESTHALSGAEVFNSGERLFRTRGCVACHPMETTDKTKDHRNTAPVRRKFAPPLKGIHGKLKSQRWLPSWLLAPRRIRPGTMMPDFQMTPSVACDISAFLWSLNAPHSYAALNLSTGSAAKGQHLFTYRGCRACHLTNYDKDAEISRIPSLNDAGIKLRPDWTLLELEQPRAYNPDARIPLLDVTKEDTVDIIAYLNTLGMGENYFSAECPDGSTRGLAQGRHRVEYYGCHACHSIDGFAEAAPPGAPLGARGLWKAGSGQKPWQTLRRQMLPARRTSEEANLLRMPLFHLSEKEIQALVTFLMKTQADAPEGRHVQQSKTQRFTEAGEDLLAAYNCRHCHMLRPGTPPHISTLIDRAHLLPPRLVEEGMKVQPQWLVKYLKKPFFMRIWMSMRMPYFYLGYDEAETLARFFQAGSGLAADGALTYRLPIDVRPISAEEQELGRYRFHHDRCIQCHPTNLNQALPNGVAIDDLAINLTLTKTRLRYEWVREFLRNPDRFAGPDTRMPFIYFTPEGQPKVSDASQWLGRVARYLFLIDTLPVESPGMDNRREEVDVTKFWENY